MAYPTFSKATLTTVVFSKGDVYPGRSPETFHQVVGVSEGGQVRVHEVSPPERFLVRVFERMPQEDRDNYYNWIHNALINGRLGTFTFTDTDSTAYTVRWWEDTLDLAQVAFGLWTWTTTMRVEVA
jgi:hypothetical protein